MVTLQSGASIGPIRFLPRFGAGGIGRGLPGRLHHIADARIEIEEALSVPTEESGGVAPSDEPQRIGSLQPGLVLFSRDHDPAQLGRTLVCAVERAHSEVGLSARRFAVRHSSKALVGRVASRTANAIHTSARLWISVEQRG